MGWLADCEVSANNIVYINRKTFKVYYQGCADNAGYGEEIGQGKDLEEAVDIAQKLIKEELGGVLEYGINFIGKGGEK